MSITSPLWWTRSLRVGDRGHDVTAAQELFGLPQTGEYDYDLAIMVRGLQKMKGLEPTGELDEETARAMGPRSRDAVPPTWWADVDIVPATDLYVEVSLAFGGEDGIRRLQGNYGIYPTGVIDQQLALIMGALGEAR